MPTYPSSLPNWKFPLSDKADEGFIRTKMDSGPAKVRRRYSAVPRRFQTEMNVTGAQRDTLNTFYHDTLGEGALSFDRTDPTTDVTGSFRFLTTPGFRILAGASDPDKRIYRVTLSLEKLPS